MSLINFFKKALLIVVVLAPMLGVAQEAKKPVSGWQNLDLKTDSVFGIGTERAYAELLKGKKHTTVVVAVIDAGVDTAHEDLKTVLWMNPKEKKNDGVDNDNNGYKDDINGWSFLGSDNGNVQFDNLEITRLVRMYKSKFATMDTTKLSASDLITFGEYIRLRNQLDASVAKAKQNYDGVNNFKVILDNIVKSIGKAEPTRNELAQYQPKNSGETYVQKTILGMLSNYASVSDLIAKEITPGLDHYKEELEYSYNVDYDPRHVVGDKYENSSERFYGTKDVTGPNADHGTHVAGIIAADRINNTGIQGVANDVKIMVVRTVPQGDERDKDVANAIRYAAANGARVINMSFGKSQSYDKKAVDDAVKFAMSKDVLIVHSAGNDNKNTDLGKGYPNRVYEDKSGEAQAWIEVGASGPTNDAGLKASFSNYGKTTVDVFAPGVNINSTTPGSKYALHSGTSMATPVVSGLAALIRSYYPKLTAIQVKDIILKSVVKVDHNVTVKMGTNSRDVAFDELCATGGIVNAYNALKLAASYR